MKNAAAITASAHRRAMRVIRPGMYEYQLQAEIEHEFLYQGATCPAYTTIVGGGKNACVLHYIKNQDLLVDGDLVLVDAGCEYYNYCADITRTFPVNGRFTRPQASIYEVVLEAQAEAIKSIAPGGTILHIGLTHPSGSFDFKKLTIQEVTLVGTYCYTNKDFEQTLKILNEKKLGDLGWIDYRDLKKGSEAFNEIHNGTCVAPKIILIP